MLKGIIIVKYFGIYEPVRSNFTDWLVLVSSGAKHEIEFFPIPN